jgi:hypothetical protein
VPRGRICRGESCSPPACLPVRPPARPPARLPACPADGGTLQGLAQGARRHGPGSADQCTPRGAAQRRQGAAAAAAGPQGSRAKGGPRGRERRRRRGRARTGGSPAAAVPLAMQWNRCAKWCATCASASVSQLVAVAPGGGPGPCCVRPAPSAACTQAAARRVPAPTAGCLKRLHRGDRESWQRQSAAGRQAGGGQGQGRLGDLEQPSSGAPAAQQQRACSQQRPPVAPVSRRAPQGAEPLTVRARGAGHSVLAGGEVPAQCLPALRPHLLAEPAQLQGRRGAGQLHDVLQGGGGRGRR